MGKNAAAIAPRLTYDAYSPQVVVPFFYGKGVCIRPGIFFKRIEFGTFKIGIMQTFP